MEGYYNVISLGYYCDVSKEIEKRGLRNFSGPFDWLITYSIVDVIECIEKNFFDFLNEDFLYQNCKNRDYYKNIKYNFYFFHDFDAIHSLNNQIKNVKSKYERRITRFYSEIKKPTIFIREINIENDLVEYKYILNNYEKIQSVFKKFNQSNKVFFIVNKNFNDSITIPKKSEKYFDFFSKISNLFLGDKKNNLFFFRHKKKKSKLRRKIFYLFNKITRRLFIYEKEY